MKISEKMQELIEAADVIFGCSCNCEMYMPSSVSLNDLRNDIPAEQEFVAEKSFAVPRVVGQE